MHSKCGVGTAWRPSFQAIGVPTHACKRIGFAPDMRICRSGHFACKLLLVTEIEPESEFKNPREIITIHMAYPKAHRPCATASPAAVRRGCVAPPKRILHAPEPDQVSSSA